MRTFFYKHAERVSKWIFSYDPSELQVSNPGNNFEEKLMNLAGELRTYAASKPANGYYYEVPLTFYKNADMEG